MSEKPKDAIDRSLTLRVTLHRKKAEPAIAITPPASNVTRVFRRKRRPKEK